MKVLTVIAIPSAPLAEMGAPVLLDGYQVKEIAADTGCWILSCDVDARGGMGRIELTTNLDAARHFRDAADALRYWKRTSRVQPARADGKPNRPLTVCTVSVDDA